MSDLVPLIRTELPGGSPLSRAAREGRLPQWYRPRPSDTDSWRSYAADVLASVSAGWLNDLRGAIQPSGRAAARLERSAGGKGLVITTGQQPGLFGGPLMTLLKAISARALADELQERLGIPVAPLFWAATDDADFDEASVVSVALPGGAHELRLEQRTPPGTPMARVPLDADITALADGIRRASGSAPHAGVLEAALHAWRDGATIGDAYVELLRHVLEPLEIAVLDASHACVAEAAAPALLRAALNADAVAAAVRARTDEIEAAGFTAQVEQVKGLSLVFLNADGVKRRLPIRDAESLGQVSHGQFLSATVLLRPVVERAILPSAAYVAGPGEIAYFAQVSAVADALGLPVPLVAPRWSATIVDADLQQTLDRLRLDVSSLADPHAAESMMARDVLPAAVSRAISELRSHAEGDVRVLRAAADSLAPAAVFDGLARSIDHRVARAERRVLAAVKRRESESMRTLATLRGALFPHGVRQERKLAYVPFLARHGSPLLDAMIDGARMHARGIVESPVPSLARDQVPVTR